MARLRLALLFALLIVPAAPAVAHPVPFSYLDLRVSRGRIDVTLVAHLFDVAHELEVQPPERLLDPAVLQPRGNALAQLLGGRVQITADGRPLHIDGWSAPEPLPERQSIRLRARITTAGEPGAVTVVASLFPYDPVHQTFVNVYEGDRLAAQAMLDRRHDRFDHFSGTAQGTLALVRKFIPAGVHHILIGPDHLLFLVGLLLLGGSTRRLLLVVSAFTVAHSVTLSLAALNIVTPPARVVEPAIAMSIVVVGVDNLLVRGGRDLRAWIAFGFGFVHGFGFAGVLREMDLPRRALGWSLFSFNVGVEIGQVCVVGVVAAALAAVRARSEWAGRQLAVAGSVVVVVAGAFWFIERIFFPGGIS